MIHKLHIQLTALCMAITGLILAILSGICLYISESGIREQEYTSFLTSLNTMYQNLEVQTSLSHNWIRQMEYNFQFKIRIIDNGTPLFFEQFSRNKEEEALLRLVEETAETEYGINISGSSSSGRLREQATFTVKDQKGDSYYASAAVFPRSGPVLGVAVLHPLAQMNSRVVRQRASFFLADMAALALLTVFFWFFTSRILRPLQENRRKQMQFVASASHELRSPLTVILTNVAAVQNGIIPGDSHFLETISLEGKRMSRLITDMLQLASADNHTWSMNPAEVELDTLLLQTWEYFEPQAASKHLHWNIILPEDAVPPVICDPERIRQLLAILIDNAFSYTPEGGNVCLALIYGNDFRIQITDNGPGIPDEQKKAVFERFHRIDSSRKDKSHFGLGLCIAKEIIQLHKGRLLLTDTPGGGATFTVILPKNQQTSAAKCL